MPLELDELERRLGVAARMLGVELPPEQLILGWLEQAQTLAEE